MTLAFRTAGAWGAGEGGRLPSHTIDLNFYELLTRIEAIEADPPEARGIAGFTVIGTSLTVQMTDLTTEGPFILPTATFVFRDEWLPDTVYVASTLLTNSGTLYYVNYNHVSAATFEPGANDGLGHSYYKVVLAKPRQPYDIGLYFGQQIIGDSAIMLQHIAVRSFTIPADFEGSQAFLTTAVTTENLILPIRVNGELVATIEFVVGLDLEDGFGPGQFGTFLPVTSPGEDLAILAADRVRIYAPALNDATAFGLSVTLACQTEAL